MAFSHPSLEDVSPVTLFVSIIASSDSPATLAVFIIVALLSFSSGFTDFEFRNNKVDFALRSRVLIFGTLFWDSFFGVSDL